MEVSRARAPSGTSCPSEKKVLCVRRANIERDGNWQTIGYLTKSDSEIIAPLIYLKMLLIASIAQVPVMSEVELVCVRIPLGSCPDFDVSFESNAFQVQGLVQICSETSEASPVGQGI